MFLITKLPYGGPAPGAEHFVCEKCGCEWSASQEDIVFDYDCKNRLSTCPYCKTYAKVPFRDIQVKSDTSSN